MIGKIPDKRKDGRSSFRDLVAYCTAKDPSKVIHVGSQNLLSAETAALEMEALATDNARCRDPVFHAILAWREMEVPTDEQVDEAVHIALTELGLQNCQALWALQTDTQNRHAHIVVNRIDPETGRAVIPANGWTYRALERAARRIELTQGWESEQSGFYTVTDDGKIVEKAKKAEPAISPSARDGEAHTAMKSAERICREVAVPVIRAAGSWKELHEKLAEEGIAFEAKGSGAVLRVGEVAVKASKVSRDASMSKLEARLGDYRARPEGTVAIQRAQEPTERAARSDVKSEWERFSAAREKYSRAKKEENTALVQRHKEERANLWERQKAERDREFAGSWKGRGALLNRLRSVTAARQQGEKLDLAERQKKETDDCKRKYPRRFVSFKTWLEEGEEQSAFLSFRYPNQGAMFGSIEAEGTFKADLRAFMPKAGNRGGVAYSRKGAKEADFIDYGKKIILSEKCGDAAVLAALQLACQKWGSAWIQGTEGYKKLCTEAAARHNLKIANPELAEKVERERKRLVGLNHQSGVCHSRLAKTDGRNAKGQFRRDGNDREEVER